MQTTTRAPCLNHARSGYGQVANFNKPTLTANESAWLRFLETSNDGGSDRGCHLSPRRSPVAAQSHDSHQKPTSRRVRRVIGVKLSGASGDRQRRLAGSTPVFIRWGRRGGCSRCPDRWRRYPVVQLKKFSAHPTTRRTRRQPMICIVFLDAVQRRVASGHGHRRHIADFIRHCCEFLLLERHHVIPELSEFVK